MIVTILVNQLACKVMQNNDVVHHEDHFVTAIQLRA
jgi:hypothetical protein